MDINAFLKQLDENTAQLQDQLKNVSEGQLLQKPWSGWNAIEVAEHVFLTEQVVKKLLRSPSEQLHSENEVLGAEKIKRLMIDLRSRKVQAPDMLKPTGIFSNKEQFLQQMDESREELKTSLINGRLQVSSRVYKHPMLGEMTVSDWLYFIIHHCERHMKQIEDLVTSH